MDCEDMLKEALNKNRVSEEDVDDLIRQASILKRRIQAGKLAADLGEEVRKYAQDWSLCHELELVAKKRAVLLQADKRINAVRFAMERFQGMELEGVSALQVGSKYNREGARLSVDSIGSGLEGLYIHSLLNEIGELGGPHTKLFASGDMDREIARAMWHIDNPQGGPWQGAPEAMAIGEIINKWQERARMDANMAGAWIGKLPGYIVRQSHDPAKMRKQGFENWRSFIVDRLDWTRTADGEFDPALDPDAANNFLKSVYEGLVTGIHMTASHNEQSLARPGVTGSQAARMSRERVLHFKSGGDWFDYNVRFGIGNLREAVARGLSMSARSTALMRVFGPSPQANLYNIIRDIQEKMRRAGDVEGGLRVTGRHMLNRIQNQMAEIDGTINLEGSPALAAVGRNVRAIESMAKLGGAVISSISDAPNFAMEFKYQGKGFWGSLARGLSLMAQGTGSNAEQKIMAECGVFCDSICGSVAARFSGSDLPGKMTALQNTFFKLNLLSWWTDSWKKAATLMMSHGLAFSRHNAWDALDMPTQRALALYNLDAGQWDMLRKGAMTAADGREYMTPETAYQVDIGEIKSYLGRYGDKISDEAASQFRETMADRLRAYFRDRVQYAVLEPDARIKAIGRQGLPAGTPSGEALRFIMQFKTFPLLFLQRSVNREIYGRSTDRFWKGMGNQFVRDSYGERGNLAGLVVMMTMFGYAAMTIKQLLAGKTPRDPGRWNTWIAAFAQGGGAGIYGDFLFGEKSRMGDNFLSTLAGPTFGSLSGLHRLYTRLRDGEDVKSQAFREFFNLVPGNNLFWFRTAFDHMIGYNLYEMMNPGYLRRMERRIAKENGQTFWWKPSR